MERAVDVVVGRDVVDVVKVVAVVGGDGVLMLLHLVDGGSVYV